MGIIVANLFVTLDGVYQAPGGSEEEAAGAPSVAGAGAVSRKPTTRGWTASFCDIAGDFVVIEFPVFYR